MQYRIYCDESCHLEHDNSKVMVLGCVYCPEKDKQKIFDEIRNIKQAHGLDPFFEIKWTKVSESKKDFYLDLIRYFWESDNIYYRGLVVKDKEKLNHVKYNSGSHNLWYYKMYFLMLNAIIQPDSQYRIFLDIKDTRGEKHTKKLHEVLCNNQYDFKHDVIKTINQINSKESELLQLADLINGAICYYNRNLYNKAGSNEGKNALVKKLLEKQDLSCKTKREEQKFNLLIWTPREV